MSFAVSLSLRSLVSFEVFGFYCHRCGNITETSCIKVSSFGVENLKKVTMENNKRDNLFAISYPSPKNSQRNSCNGTTSPEVKLYFGEKSATLLISAEFKDRVVVVEPNAN